MDPEVQAIEQQQQAVWEEMGRIRVMRRGTLSQQRYPQRRARRGGHGACGPYCLWQGYVKGRRFGRRVAAAEAERMRTEIAERRRFEGLCAVYVALGEALAERQGRPGVWEEARKKTGKSPSRRTRKSRG